MRYSFLVIFIAITVYSKVSAQNRPTGLLTDLLSHTDRVYLNGYPSAMPLQDVDQAIEPVQFAEVLSARPSLSWVVPGTINNTVQTAYHIIVAGSLSDAALGKGTVWDSKSVKSNKSVAIIYGGEDLKPGKIYYWRVKTFTNTGGESDWSDIKTFKTGKQLETYKSSYDLLIKTPEQPVNVSRISSAAQIADFGKDAFGQLSVTLFSETGLDTVQINLGEALLNNRINPHPGGTIRFQTHSLTLIKGRHTYRIKIAEDKRNTGPAAIKMPEYIGEVLPFRYVEITGYKPPVSTSDVIREMVHHPFDDGAAYFKSNDETLNQIWDLCKYSVKATSFAGIYIDGDRERIPYEADALINQLCHYSTDREYSMARRSVEYLLKQPTWPTEWILQALIISWNDYLYTGDARSLTANYELLKSRTLLRLREKNGLISTTTGLQTPEVAASVNFTGKIKDIVDWPLSETDGFVFTNYNAVTNAYHYQALVIMEKIAEVLNKKQDAGFYSGQHKMFKNIFNKAFLDKSKGIYKDGDTTDHMSLHANMFAMDFGLVPDQYQSSVMKFIASRGMACSVYGSQFLLDALYKGSDADQALSLMTATNDRSWYNMLRAGSTITLEAWDNKFKPNQDWNHIWGAAPANIIPRRLIGVEPAKAGYESVIIRPQIGNLTFAESVIPTIRGDVKIKVHNDQDFMLIVTLPANMEGNVYLPFIKGKNKISYNGKPLKIKHVNSQSFIYAGKIGSGEHIFRMTSDL